MGAASVDELSETEYHSLKTELSFEHQTGNPTASENEVFAVDVRSINPEPKRVS
jgi:hypothetical protein